MRQEVKVSTPSVDILLLQIPSGIAEGPDSKREGTGERDLHGEVNGAGSFLFMLVE